MQSKTHERWTAIEDQFADLNAPGQVTQFVRHVITLKHGYVLPRDLYQVVTKNYRTSDSVDELLTFLEGYLLIYSQMVDPSLDVEVPEVPSRSFAILEALGLRTIRPVFLAVLETTNPDEGIRELLRIIVPRIVNGTFGTGGIESQFAKAAQTIFREKAWTTAIETLQILIPPRGEFEARISTRPLNKSVALVLRISALQKSVTPDLRGFLHYLRPRGASGWPGFQDEDYRLVGGTLGNSIVAEVERRPHGSNNPAAVRTKLVAKRVPEEHVTPANFAPWTAQSVRTWNEVLSESLGELWYE